VAKGS